MNPVRCLLSVALMVLTFRSVAADPSPPGKVQDSSLPYGPGLAANAAGDRDLASNPAVIFTEDFEAPDWKGHWDEVRDREGEVLAVTKLGGSNDPFGQSLKVTAILGRDTGGGASKWFSPTETVFIRFYTRFDPRCDYVHHFVTLRANAGLQGKERWSGFGGAGLKPEGHERFSTALEPWGNWARWPAPGRWNFYSYWHEMKPSPDGKYWGNSFRPEDQPDIEKDRWICAEFMLRHNTPGERDGEQAFWIDGRLRGHWTGISWRKAEGLMANALTLESYVTDRWTKNRTNIVYFDNLVIARQYIGPMAGPR